MLWWIFSFTTFPLIVEFELNSIILVLTALAVELFALDAKRTKAIDKYTRTELRDFVQ